MPENPESVRLPWRCQDEGHEFACRMGEGSCLRCLPQRAQAQGSFTDQLVAAHAVIVSHGLYDVADWMRKAFSTPSDGSSTA